MPTEHREIMRAMLPPVSAKTGVPSTLTPAKKPMTKSTPKAPSKPAAKKDSMAGMDHSKMPGMKMPADTAKTPLAKKSTGRGG
ncbi:MAG: hypothetical protein Q7S20_09190 [Gemmatimonadaceae bacterium]|nr:hypothetical protein [Gemmatimonadaceae bacterium]